MYHASHFHIKSRACAEWELEEGQDFRVLQLTDSHFGFGPLSKKPDEETKHAIRFLVRRARPDLVIFTGDMIFPFLPKSGTLDNRRQAECFTEFMDSLGVPYALALGNHDAEQFSFCSRRELVYVFQRGKNCIILPGPFEISGDANYFINLVQGGVPVLALAVLDTHMYAGRNFFSGFDCIHEDQTAWTMTQLDQIRAKNPDAQALAFFHMPLPEYKSAYKRMKMGDPSIQYHFGSVLEENEYFGISSSPCPFFWEAKRNGMIKGMFCGHDHLNTISLTFEGIRLTYGMSLDFQAYRDIRKKYTQRGGDLIIRKADGRLLIKPVPLGPVVSTTVKGR